MRKHYFLCISAFTLMLGAINMSCSSDDKNPPENPPVQPPVINGVPSDEAAGQAPEVTANTVTIPNISAPYVEVGSEGAIGNISMTGIKGLDGEFMKLIGTSQADQNIWMTIDGKPKSIAIVNGNEATTKAAAKGLADIVFLVDDSGSMGEEADSIAKQIMQWSKVLEQTVDCRFGCVGYGANYSAIDGAMNLNVVDSLEYYLNQRKSSYYYGSSTVRGTYRTQGFWGADSARLSDNVANYDHQGYYECGVTALYYADKEFTFRDGANRIYLNFTDEPNQPDRKSQWSVETLNPKDSLGIYNWNPSKGTVHSIYSESDTLNYIGPNGYYYPANKQSLYYNEAPWLMSDYTGGITLFTNPYFREFRLDNIEVTAAIVSTYILRFNITDELRNGLHTIEIIIKDSNNNQAKKKFENVSFNF